MEKMISLALLFLNSPLVLAGPQLKAVRAVLSSQYSKSFQASKCIDEIDGKSMCISKSEMAPWLALDFGRQVSVGRVVLHNRGDCCGDRLRNVDVRVSDSLPQTGSRKFTGGTLLGSFTGPSQDGRKEEIKSSTEHKGRYVVVQINAGKTSYLNLAEVTAWTGGGPQLKAQTAVLSSQLNKAFQVSKCIDGIYGKNFNGQKNICHSKSEMAPWLALDFGRQVSVGRVVLHNRGDCCGDRLRNVDVRVSDTLPQTGSRKFTGGTLLGSFTGPSQDGRNEEIKSSTERKGRYVVVQINAGKTSYLNLAEVTVWTEVTTTPPTTTGPTLAPETCQCGVKGSVPNTRIVGGQESQANKYPWQVGLYYDNSFKCGGTLISLQHVLTAAHCTDGMSASFMRVLLGENVINDNSFTRVGVSQIIQDPNWNSKTKHDSDFAILQLAQHVSFSSTVSPACLPHDRSQTYEGQLATVTGWGRLSSRDARPAVLHEVNVTVTSQQTCRNAYGSSRITDLMLCAMDSGKDSCQGDSGGPLITPENGRQALIGVVSWGSGCARPNVPGVYARVTRRMDWILANTAGTFSSTCQALN